MATYLFLWNPTKWDWIEQKDLIAQLPYKKPIRQWATVSTKNITIGDKFILMKIGSIPKSDKGVIGIGTVKSMPYLDKDFLKSDVLRSFVKLEFEQLTEHPLITLDELEHQYPQQNWTPQSSGVLLRDEHITDKILSTINLPQRHSTQPKIFKKNDYFPLIAEIIDTALAQKTSIHRDEIAKRLVETKSIPQNTNKNKLSIAGNIVDWFSAELTQNSKIVELWQHKYKREKIMIKGRKITNYLLNSNVLQEEEIPNNIVYKEGSLKKVLVNAYERNPQARQKCLAKYGYSCQCCGFNFEHTYGEIGKNFIHVHHIIPLSQIKNEYTLDAEKDLIPVCANCHAMLHRKIPPYTIYEIKALLHQ